MKKLIVSTLLLMLSFSSFGMKMPTKEKKNETTQTSQQNINLGEAIRLGDIKSITKIVTDNKIDFTAAIGTKVLLGAIKAIYLNSRNITKEIIEIFINNGANINLANERDETPLITAIHINPSSDFIQFLISKGADVNLKSKNISPLASAIILNQHETVKLLIEHGATFDASRLELVVNKMAQDMINILKTTKPLTSQTTLTQPITSNISNISNVQPSSTIKQEEELLKLDEEIKERELPEENILSEEKLPLKKRKLKPEFE